MVIVGRGTRRRGDRYAAMAEDAGRLPELQQQQQAAEADDRAGDVGQVGAEEVGHRPLADDVAKRPDDGERPAIAKALLAGDQVDQHPGRQQRQDRDDGADRTGQCQQRIAGDRGQGDDRCTQGAVRDRGVVGDGGDTDGVQVAQPQGDQDRRHHGPGITEADQALQQRAEGPGEQHGLHADVQRALRHQPAAEALEQAAGAQRVEQHQTPEGDPVDVPHAGGGAVDIGAEAGIDRHPPHPGRESESNDRTDQDCQPGRHAEHREQHQQQHDRHQGDQAGQSQVADRINNLREHQVSLSPLLGWYAEPGSGRSDASRRSVLCTFRQGNVISCARLAQLLRPNAAFDGIGLDLDQPERTDARHPNELERRTFKVAVQPHFGFRRQSSPCHGRRRPASHVFSVAHAK